ncbi:hypothetical protein CROQUDRAFT_650624 [Cronartium quercuum f. sp. fusiforme G11]|uniref:Senescence domain-containing protein n=1 Tax=Cronartium quercuum f. sp. fusiforme G11 TaxID=708437 RepID=A0A9P6NU73_9BASI|nr:hypothetical protein CROQUDRAFT_650624 [Cronartium quercuum f. sp. fusiforme G11]
MADGTILLSLPNVSAFQIGPGKSETVLVSSTTLAVKLIDIPSTVLKVIPSSSEPPSYDADSLLPPVVVDTWLVLSLADGLIDIPLSANSPVSFQAPRSYIIPIASDDGQQSSEKKDGQGEVRLELAEGFESDAVDTLDGILAGWTSYPGRSPAPFQEPVPVVQTENIEPNKGRLALMDEKTGEICGELTSNIVLNGPSGSSLSRLTHLPPHPTSVLVASEQPVMVSLHTSSNENAMGNFPVAEISSGPRPGSSLLSSAEWVSRGILAGADWLANQISSGEKTYLNHTSPVTVPMTFSTSTKARTERVVGFTQTATKVSGKTAKIIGGIAAKVGDQIGKSTGIQHGPRGEPPKGARGYVSRGVLAFNTVLDSIEYGGKKVLSTAGSSATNMVTHSYGNEAGQLAGNANQCVQNVALVYIDARGVTRKALLKSAGKAAVRGRMNDGREVVFGTDANVDQWSEKGQVDQKQVGVGPTPPPNRK